MFYQIYNHFMYKMYCLGLHTIISSYLVNEIHSGPFLFYICYLLLEDFIYKMYLDCTLSSVPFHILLPQDSRHIFLSTSQLSFLSYLFRLLMQLAQPICTLVWGHSLEHEQSTKYQNPKEKWLSLLWQTSPTNSCWSKGGSSGATPLDMLKLLKDLILSRSHSCC